MSTNLLNGENILRKVYDPPTQSLKTNVTAIVPPGTITVAISDTDDSIKLGDGTGNYLDINPNGSINVVVTESGLTTKNVFGEVDNVASGVTTVIHSYTALADTKLLSCDFAGTNVATYSLYIGSDLSAKKYTYFTSLSDRFEFADGLPVTAGDVISVEVIHMRPDMGNFNVNILIKN